MSAKRQRGRRPPVWVSQNFLTSYKTIERVLRRTNLHADDHVIEIGPGKGHTTARLLQKCHKVTAIEIDGKLYAKLLEKFSDAENLQLHHQDFLQWRLPSSGSYKVFANLPFCYTTDILRKLTESKNPPVEAWLTMEKGAAKRFLGKPRETLRSLLIQPKFDLGIVYYFRREDFHPKPGVDVVMVHIRKKAQPDIPPSRWNDYKRFLSSALGNGSAGLLRMFTKRQLSRAFQEAGISDAPSGEILYVQWLCLFRCYCDHVIKKGP